MAMRRFARARLRIILAPIQQHRAHPGIARGVEFLDDVGQEHDVPGIPAELRGNAAIAVRIALAARPRCRTSRENKRASDRRHRVWPNNSFCAGTEPDEYTVQRHAPQRASARSAGAASG